MNARATRKSAVTLIVSGIVIAVAQPPAAEATGRFKEIQTPSDARRMGLDSLRLAVQRDGGVPLPPNLSEFIKDRKAAVQLGKALFWDMQVGSDGVQSCASCHFHAGADNRTRNALNPALQIIFDTRGDDVVGYFNAEFANGAFRFEARPPNGTLRRENFPLVKSIQRFNRTADGIIEPVPGNSNDVVGSMGVTFAQFAGITKGSAVDVGMPLADPVFNSQGINIRRVEPRNTPSVINAVFNFTNFWDGRASPIFNGVGAFGFHDPLAPTLVNRPEGLVVERVAIDLASLASQAVQPPRNPNEMSFNFRSFPEIGLKLLRASPTTGQPLVPLAKQRVERDDSVLGPLANVGTRGLSTTYEALIKQAFVDKYWDSPRMVRAPGIVTTEPFTQMEFNFGLFFGLSVMMYQSTLVADQSPFDQWMETGRFNLGFGFTELAGLNLFAGQGECTTCHEGPELTAASVRASRGGTKVIRAMKMANGVALYDNGFYNTSVTPSTDDAGRGDLDINNNPLASARQALFERLEIAPIGFPILGGDTIPARDEDTGAPVCNDVNNNKFCDFEEPILPAYRRVAVDGAFKTPGLRNVELTGPYFHNGGVATLRQVVQFYNRGGNFCQFNSRDLDPSIKPLGLNKRQEEELVAFMVALTDRRVKFQRAPFDHPELHIPEDGLDASGTRTIRAVGARGSLLPLQPFLELDPQDAIFTPAGTCRVR